MKVERWGIVGEHGLYVGQRLTRDEAIKEHVEALYGYGSNEQQYQEWWERCRQRGDRAVKLTIEYDDV